MPAVRFEPTLLHATTGESGAYAPKWLEIVKLYGEKVVARYAPTRQSRVGVIITPPPATALSKVGKYAEKILHMRGISILQHFRKIDWVTSAFMDHGDNLCVLIKIN